MLSKRFTRAGNGFTPFFLTVSMIENIVQKLDPSSVDRKVPATFIFSLLILKDRSVTLLENGTRKSVKNLITSSLRVRNRSRRLRILSSSVCPVSLLSGCCTGFERVLSQVFDHTSESTRSPVLQERKKGLAPPSSASHQASHSTASEVTVYTVVSCSE